MVQFSRPFDLALVLSSYAACGLAGQVQLSNIKLPASAAGIQAEIKQMFSDSYNAYRKYAFGHDDLLPVSASFSDGRNGWGASIVDALPTMYIMGFNDFFEEALNYTQTIDFSESQVVETVSVFETTIRYVGGLLSAYELSGKRYQVFVDKAKQVADKMAYAWRTYPNQTIPFGEIWFNNNSAVVDTSNIAEAGTLDIEWSRLSLYTNNQTYTQLTEGSVRSIAKLATPLPGLAPQGIDPSTNTFVGNYLTWGGGSDSYFEYLIKYARITNANDDLADTWHAAVDSSIQNMARRSTVGNHLYISDWDDGELIHVGSHLECFHGGNWIYGGHLLNNQTIINYGLDLVDACWNTYASTATGIGPEVFFFLANDEFNGNGQPSTQAQQQFYNEHGFWITASDYILRPEVLESNFYAFRTTGDTKYLDRAASAVVSLKKYLPQKSGGFAGLNDVDNPKGGFIDDQESFWFAEVLKYLYLTFDNPEHISLNDYVFNTEGQPFEAPVAKYQYGSGQPATVNGQFISKSGLPLPAISPNPFLPSPLPTPPPNA
ncbi:glycoside hydrolase family 47 protein [Collybiopsis luxurians FD-317 M1]|nr:glycoside hydrolase family 47 protein [Collybiopsis luxurians FD-317 M1]